VKHAALLLGVDRGQSLHTESNDDVAFTTVSYEKENPRKVKRRRISNALGARTLGIGRKNFPTRKQEYVEYG